MGEVAYDKTMGVGRVALKADTIASRTGRTNLGSIVNTDIYLIIDNFIEPIRLGFTLRQIVDEASSGISNLKS